MDRASFTISTFRSRLVRTFVFPHGARRGCRVASCTMRRHVPAASCKSGLGQISAADPVLVASAQAYPLRSCPRGRKVGAYVSWDSAGRDVDSGYVVEAEGAANEVVVV